jgi:hypothetical protein
MGNDLTKSINNLKKLNILNTSNKPIYVEKYNIVNEQDISDYLKNENVQYNNDVSDPKKMERKNYIDYLENQIDEKKKDIMNKEIIHNYETNNKNKKLNDTTYIKAYSSNDYFYSIASENKIIDDEKLKKCHKIDVYNEKKWNNLCNEDNFHENKEKCIQRELCINKNFANDITNVKNKMSEADERYSNSVLDYKTKVNQTINLGIGIMILIGLIMKLKNS